MEQDIANVTVFTHYVNVAAKLFMYSYRIKNIGSKKLWRIWQITV